MYAILPDVYEKPWILRERLPRAGSAGGAIGERDCQQVSLRCFGERVQDASTERPCADAVDGDPHKVEFFSCFVGAL
jgi:hypothetical protein